MLAQTTKGEHLTHDILFKHSISFNSVDNVIVPFNDHAFQNIEKWVD